MHVTRSHAKVGTTQFSAWCDLVPHACEIQENQDTCAESHDPGWVLAGHERSWSLSPQTIVIGSIVWI